MSTWSRPGGPTCAACAGACHAVVRFVLLLAVRGRTPGIQHHNVVPGEYDAEFDSPLRKGRRPGGRPDDLRVRPGRPAMRPDEDHESWFVLVSAPRDGAGPGTVDWRAQGMAEAYADHVPAVLARRGVDLRERILWRVVRTPADLADGRAHPAGRSTGRRPTAPGRPSYDPPTPPRSGASFWSAARRTPAAACRWSACPPRSWPTSSGATSATVGARWRRPGRGPPLPAPGRPRTRRRAATRPRPDAARRPAGTSHHQHPRGPLPRR